MTSFTELFIILLFTYQAALPSNALVILNNTDLNIVNLDDFWYVKNLETFKFSKNQGFLKIMGTNIISFTTKQLLGTRQAERIAEFEISILWNIYLIQSKESLTHFVFSGNNLKILQPFQFHPIKIIKID